MPWAPLQVEWDGGDGTEPLDFVNPWAVTVLAPEGGRVDPRSRIEYAPFRELFKHQHSLLDRPRPPPGYEQQVAAVQAQAAMAAAAAAAQAAAQKQQQVRR
jgi:hypothetical protein